MLNKFYCQKLGLKRKTGHALCAAIGLLISMVATAQTDLNRFSTAVQSSQKAFSSQVQLFENALQDPNLQNTDSLFSTLNDINLVKNQNFDPVSFGFATQKTGDRIKHRIDYIYSQLTTLSDKIKHRDLAASIEPYTQSLVQIKEQIRFLEEDAIIFNSVTTELNNSTSTGLPLWITLGLGLIVLVLTGNLIRTVPLLRKERAATALFREKLENLERANKEALKQIRKIQSNSSDTNSEIQNLDHQIHDLMNQENIDEINRIVRNNEDLDDLLQKLRALIYKAVATASADSENLAVITDLVKFVEEISSKTKVIHDIAFKTKVLSFNASVEAERAGARGRGFSVVAQEMKRLAEISGKAAEDIGAIVDRTRRSTQLLASNDPTEDRTAHSSLLEAEGKVERLLDKVNELKSQLNSILQQRDYSLKSFQQITRSIQQISTTQKQSIDINNELIDYHSLHIDKSA